MLAYLDTYLTLKITTMKLLENVELEQLSYTFGENAKDCCIDVSVETSIFNDRVQCPFGRLEAYSCKMITSDKKQWKKSQQSSNNAPQPLSPPEKLPWLLSSSWTQIPRLRHFSEPGCSSLNNDIEESGLVYADAISSRTLFELRSVMNSSFQDYDFSSTKSEAFSLIPNFETLSGLVDAKLSATVTNYYEIKRVLWERVDQVIKISDCKLYRLSDVVICIFFHNKSLKRILFMSCRAFRADTAQNRSAEELWGVDV
ncbi:Repressor of RNA polymerase III transcription MAF1 [Dirofilaria immitis]|nr:Repressor of RNA polymerase III transcription MAF1 [Dirofilaria immitis]